MYFFQQSWWNFASQNIFWTLHLYASHDWEPNIDVWNCGRNQRKHLRRSFRSFLLLRTATTSCFCFLLLELLPFLFSFFKNCQNGFRRLRFCFSIVTVCKRWFLFGSCLRLSTRRSFGQMSFFLSSLTTNNNKNHQHFHTYLLDDVPAVTQLFGLLSILQNLSDWRAFLLFKRSLYVHSPFSSRTRVSFLIYMIVFARIQFNCLFVVSDSLTVSIDENIYLTLQAIFFQYKLMQYLLIFTFTCLSIQSKINILIFFYSGAKHCWIFHSITFG